MCDFFLFSTLPLQLPKGGGGISQENRLKVGKNDFTAFESSFWGGYIRAFSSFTVQYGIDKEVLSKAILL